MTAVPPSTSLEPAPAPDSDRGRAPAVIGYVLLALSLFTAGLSGLVALILAYDRKGQSGALARSHFAFQIQVFWVCFALTAAAGALWIGGLIAMLTGMPAAAPVHGSPDAQLVSLTGGLSWPADVETWSYGFSARPARIPDSAKIQLWLGSASMTVSVLFSWIGPGFGLMRLASGRPIGHRRDLTQDAIS